ncbi:MAG: GNAT family N-acetyltransferase [Deltaproteobacteria bacterium]|nr:GNAT family N-acetyltransferase [Deltaproteobacteria bacterium]
MEKINIRVLTESDLDAIVNIDTRVLGKTRRDYWKKKIELSETRPPMASLVAEIDGKVVGFILGDVSGWEFGVPDNIGWIDTIGVDPDYQNRGIGRLLFNELIKNLNEAGVNTIYTLVDWNDWDLLQFFHAMGFTRGDMINLELKI